MYSVFLIFVFDVIVAVVVFDVAVVVVVFDVVVVAVLVPLAVAAHFDTSQFLCYVCNLHGENPVGIVAGVDIFWLVFFVLEKHGGFC